MNSMPLFVCATCDRRLPAEYLTWLTDSEAHCTDTTACECHVHRIITDQIAAVDAPVESWIDLRQQLFNKGMTSPPDLDSIIARRTAAPAPKVRARNTRPLMTQTLDADALNYVPVGRYVKLPSPNAILFATYNNTRLSLLMMGTDWDLNDGTFRFPVLPAGMKSTTNRDFEVVANDQVFRCKLMRPPNKPKAKPVPKPDPPILDITAQDAAVFNEAVNQTEGTEDAKCLNESLIQLGKAMNILHNIVL